MSNEVVYKTGTLYTLSSAFASALANGAMSSDTGVNYQTALNGGGYPDAEFILAVPFTSAPTVMTTIDLYAKEKSVDGANDTAAPSTTYKQRYIESFVVSAATGTQYLTLVGRDLPRNADYYLLNNTGVAFSSTASLKAIPRTYGPA